MKSKRTITVLMALALLALLLPAQAMAAGTTPGIILGGGAVTKGSTIAMAGTEWDVVRNSTNTNDTSGRLLMTAGVKSAGKTGYWEQMGFIDTFYKDSFSDLEKAAVMSIDKSDPAGTYAGIAFADSSLSGAKLFALSASETTSYFGSDAERLPAGWWLRSRHGHADYAGVVGGAGSVTDSPFDEGFGVRPAFNLNLSSVLFSSAAEGGKSPAEGGESPGAEGAAAIYEIPSNSSGKWKLTLLDAGRSFSASVEASDSTTVAYGYGAWNLPLTYNGARTGSNEYVSALLCDSHGRARYYGHIAANSASGSVTLAMPAGLGVGKYTLRLFSEQCNGDNKTDYGSAFVSIPLTVTGVTHTVTFEMTVPCIAPEPQTVGHGNLAYEPEAQLYNGFLVTGWEYQPEGQSQRFPFDFNTPITEDMTLYSVLEGIISLKTYPANAGTAEFANGAFTATANEGYTFDHWEYAKSENESVSAGTVWPTANPYQPANVDYKTYTAIFTANTYNLTVQANNDEWGTVTSSGTPKTNSTITLTATANEGYRFKEWQTEPAGIAIDAAGKFKMPASDVTVTAVFIPGNAVSAPDFDPPGGTYTLSQNVNISCATDGAEIYYTTDGTTPTTGSPAYTGPISVSATATIKAIAARSGMMNSEVASATYTIEQRNISGATVTLSATLLEYTGSGQSVCVTDVVLDGKTLTEGVDYTVSGTTGKAANTYTVTVTGKGNYAGTATADFSIAPKPVTITGLSVSDKVYDGTETASVTGTAVVSGAVDGDAVAVSEGTASFADRNVSTGKAVTFSGYSLTGAAAGNYTLTGQPESVTAGITPKPVSAEGITAVNRHYEPDNMTVALSGGTLDGVISGDAVSVDLTGAVGTLADANAGSDKPVTVSGVKLGGADAANYALTGQPTGITVTINRAPHSDVQATGSARYGMSSEVDLSGLIEANGQVHYLNIEDPSFIFSVTPDVSGGKLSFSLKDDQALVGKTATLTLTIDNCAMNYASYRIIVTVTVADRAQINPVVSIEGWTYGQTPKAPAVSANPGDGEVHYEYKLKSADDSAYSNAIPTLAGEYTVRASVAEAGIYAAGTATADFAVRKADLTVTAKDQTYTWDGNPHGEADTAYNDPAEIAEKVIVSGLAEGDLLTSITLNGQGTDAGTYDIEVSGAGVQNAGSYNIQYVPGQLTIEKAAATVTKAPKANSLTYSGSAQALVTAGEASGGEMQYALGDANEATQPYTTSIPTGTDAGTYYVWYYVKADPNYRDSDPVRVEVKISPTDRTALNDAIAAAEAYCSSIADYADIAEPLKTAIKTAKDVAGNDNATESAVADAISALNGAVDTARADVKKTDEAAANSIIDLINALPASAGVGDKDAVAAARATYDKLTKAQKDLIPADALDRLTRAEAQVQAAEEEAAEKADDEAAANSVIDLINALPASAGVGDKDAVAAARAAYDKLTKAQKDLIPADALDRLTRAEAQVQAAEEEAAEKAVDEAAANSVIDLINALPANAGVDDKDAVAAARAAYDKLTKAQKDLIPADALDRLTRAEAQVQAAEEEAAEKAVDEAAANSVIDLINALPASAGVGDKDAVAAVRAAYDKLTKAQKDLVPTDVLDRLTRAEAQVQAAEEEAAKIDIGKCTITVKSVAYTGKAVTAKAMKAAVTVKYGKKTLEYGTDYSLAYDKKLKAVGPAKVTVEGKGKYKGSKALNFNIVPKGTAFTKLTGGEQLITLNWKNPGNITGYQVQYSLKADFKSRKTARIDKAKTLTATVKKLKANTTYYSKRHK